MKLRHGRNIGTLLLKYTKLLIKTKTILNNLNDVDFYDSDATGVH